MRSKPWAAVAAAVPLAAGCVAGPPASAAGGALGARAAAPSAGIPAGTRTGTRTATPKVPAGTTAAWLVFDRKAGKFVAGRNAHRRFRSASVVKIMIAIDYLESRKTVPAADARLLQIMLRSSDDGAASTFWARDGKGAIIVRVARRLGLSDTAPPPASYPGFWGYTSLSAYDIVRTYRYLLDRAAPAVRDTVLGHLRLSTRCGTDGFDQSFGIPGAVARPWAVKQGWSGFGDTPPTRCRPATATRATNAGAASVGAPTRVAPVTASIDRAVPRAAGTGVPDYGRPVLHTTGLLGKDDRYVMALLTAQPVGSGWSSSVARVTRLAADLHRGLS